MKRKELTETYTYDGLHGLYKHISTLYGAKIFAPEPPYVKCQQIM